MSNLRLFVLAFGLCFLVQIQKTVSIDYGAALTKSLLFYEAQRSGKLPSSQRVQWRGDSALNDGHGEGIDLVGGYYDAGDNVKFGFPMAYTVTMLAWSVVQFGPQLSAQNEYLHALNAIKWGTDYLIKAHPEPNVLYGEVGDGGSDHSCWQRPEDMSTPRTVYRIDEQHPGSDLAGETAAAFAAAAIAFKGKNPGYSNVLLKHAEQLFDFAMKYPGQYQNSIPVAGQFYSSSGYQDELLWAAAWLAQATKDNKYLSFLNTTASNSGGTRKMFSWDDKYVGAQVLITKNVLERKFPENENLGQYNYPAEEYVCNCIGKGNSNVQRTSGGLLWFNEWNNLQYVTSASFIIATYANTLRATNDALRCPAGAVGHQELISFVKSQVNYILGSNPKQMSYMVGFGPNYPKQVHHRGASIISIKKDPRPMTCTEGFGEWFHKDAANPNLLVGAIVGGPDQGDQYRDSRENYQQAEPATANNAPLVGVLAWLARM